MPNHATVNGLIARRVIANTHTQKTEEIKIQSDFLFSFAAAHEEDTKSKINFHYLVLLHFSIDCVYSDVTKPQLLPSTVISNVHRDSLFTQSQSQQWDVKESHNFSTAPFVRRSCAICNAKKKTKQNENANFCVANGDFLAIHTIQKLTNKLAVRTNAMCENRNLQLKKKSFCATPNESRLCAWLRISFSTVLLMATVVALTHSLRIRNSATNATQASNGNRHICPYKLFDISFDKVFLFLTNSQNSNVSAEWQWTEWNFSYRDGSEMIWKQKSHAHAKKNTNKCFSWIISFEFWIEISICCHSQCNFWSAVCVCVCLLCRLWSVTFVQHSLVVLGKQTVHRTIPGEQSNSHGIAPIQIVVS